MSNQLSLARARQGRKGHVELEQSPTLAQLGALAEIQDAGIPTNLSDWFESCPSVVELRSLARLWDEGSESFWPLLNGALASWQADRFATESATVGYWLGKVCREGMSPLQVLQLTRFLSEPRSEPTQFTEPSVRRYPTGGVSEKQAVVLPATLRSLSETFAFHSSFLIARRLAHTGGTRDKLSVLPGFRPFNMETLEHWNGEPPKVRYFTASTSFCPRDEMLYFLRGETGTVVELGLMVSSILAKQYALPASVVLIDVLFGPGAFLQDQAAARSFIDLGTATARALGLEVVFAARSTAAVAWRSVGNVAELYEAVDGVWNLADPAMPVDSSTEVGRALLFAEALLEQAGVLDGTDKQATLRSELGNDSLPAALARLWAEHGVDEAVIRGLRSDGPQSLLSGLAEVSIPASVSGAVYCTDMEALADLVNSRLNAYEFGQMAGSVLPGPPRRGGILLAVPLGHRVEAGQPKVTVYSDNAIPHVVLDDLDRLLPVCEMDA